MAEYWHLLSLDAPTVAGVWSWLFVRAMHLHLTLIQWMLLPAGTWLLYAADRILDGLGPIPHGPLRDRHHFHAKHRTAFLSGCAILAALLAWAIATHMNRVALQEDVWLGTFAGFYLLAVHRSRWAFPKELAVAILFAAATAVPAWSRLSTAGKYQLGLAIALFALLCWINCAGIEKWEGGYPHATTRWASLHLRAIAGAIGVLALVAAWRSPTTGLTALYLAAWASSGLLFWLDARSERLKPLHRRIAADAALLTPLALWPLIR
jgi:hypothetical protein